MQSAFHQKYHQRWINIKQQCSTVSSVASRMFHGYEWSWTKTPTSLISLNAHVRLIPLMRRSGAEYISPLGWILTRSIPQTQFNLLQMKNTKLKLIKFQSLLSGFFQSWHEQIFMRCHHQSSSVEVIMDSAAIRLLTPSCSCKIEVDFTSICLTHFLVWQDK